MVSLRRSLGLAIIGIAGVLAGAPTRMTIPLEVGNTWVYEYNKSSAFSSWTMSESGFRRTGVLMMHVDSVDKRRDSTFFTVSYSDSFSQINFADTVMDTVFPPCSSYSIKYLSYSSAIYFKDTNDTWTLNGDPFIVYLVEPDLIDTLSGGLSHHRILTTNEVSVNSLMCMKYTKTIETDSTRIDVYKNEWIFLKDTAAWIDRFGMYAKSESVFISTMQMGGLSSSQGSARTYTLKSFNGMPLVVGVASRPILLQSIDHRDYSSLKAPWVHLPGTSSPPYSKSPIFNLRGQPVKNNPAGQLLIRPAISQDRRFRNHPSTE